MDPVNTGSYVLGTAPFSRVDGASLRPGTTQPVVPGCFNAPCHPPLEIAMTAKKTPPLSSRALLAKLGIDEAAPELLLFDDEPLGSPLDNLAAALRERFEGLTHSHSLRPGDVVSWKPGLRNRRWPSYGKPAIVVETFATPVYDGETNSGSPYFREPLDVALGVFVEDGEHRGDFLVWHVDSRRLQPFTDGGC